MRKIKVFGCIVPLLFLIAFNMCTCSSSEIRIESVSVGSDIMSDGSVKDAPLMYGFKRLNSGKTVRDLFNYIYFKGDTVCFSLELNRKIPVQSVKAWFVNPLNKRALAVERLESRGERIFGFSLVGSILEWIYQNNLDDKIPPDSYGSSPIPMKIRIEIKTGQKKISSEKDCTFKIFYRD